MIDRLDGSEQILLMYLADELSSEDRRQVERMLEADGSLRTELDRLQSAQQTFVAALAELDDHSPLPVNREAATRRVGREIRDRLARPQIGRTGVERERHGGSLRWLYPFAAAAAVALAVGIWATHRPPRADDAQSDVAINQTEPPQPDNDVLFASLDDDADLQAVASSIQTNNDVMPRDELTDLMLDEQPLN